MNRLIHIFLICLTASPLWAQFENAAKDFQRISETYLNAKTLKVECEYWLFANHETTEIDSKEKVQYYQLDTTTIFVMGEIKRIITPHLLMVVDTIEKLIVIEKRRRTEEEKLPGLQMMASIEEFVTIQENDFSDGSKSYVMLADLPAMNRVEVQFDPESYLLSKMTIYYTQPHFSWDDEDNEFAKPRLEMVYLNHDTAYAPPHDGVGIQQYLRPLKKGWALKEEFKDYELTDFSIY